VSLALYLCEVLRLTFFSSLRRFMYQAVVRKGESTRDQKDKNPIVVLEAQKPPILVNPSHLGSALSAGQVFNIGVRIKTNQVS